MLKFEQTGKAINRFATLIVGFNNSHPFREMFGTRLTQGVRDHFTDETAAVDRDDVRDLKLWSRLLRREEIGDSGLKRLW